MDVVYHDDKAVHDHSPVVDQEAHTFDNYVFIFIRLQQPFPFKHRGAEEMRILCYYLADNFTIESFLKLTIQFAQNMSN